MITNDDNGDSIRLIEVTGTAADPIDPEVQRYIDRLRTEPITLSGMFDAWEPEWPFPTDVREIRLRPWQASIFGWQVWSEEIHITGRMDSTLHDDEWEAKMIVESTEVVRAPLVRWLGWVLVGQLVWRWQSRRSGGDYDDGVEEV